MLVDAPGELENTCVRLRATLGFSATLSTVIMVWGLDLGVCG